VEELTEMREDGKTLARYYDALTPQERLALLLHAQARGDAPEEERLLRSCPRRSYSMRDRAFVDRVAVLEDIVWALRWDLGRPLVQRRLLTEVRGLVLKLAAELHALSLGTEGERSTLARLVEVSAPDTSWQESSALLTKLLDDLGRTLVEEACVMWTAFSEFSRAELGIEPDVVLRALPHGQDLFALVQEHATMLAPSTTRPAIHEADHAPESYGMDIERNRVVEYRDRLVTAWRSVVRDPA
jgi:hypothetical protein